MSAKPSAANADEEEGNATASQRAQEQWLMTALTALFTAAAVLLVSIAAAVTSL
jgi:hypothetical protein